MTARSEGIRADDLAAIPGRELLIDPDAGSRRDRVRVVRVYHQAGGLAGAIDRPGFDRVLEEPDRAVHEREVGATGVVASRGGDVGGDPTIQPVGPGAVDDLL